MTTADLDEDASPEDADEAGAVASGATSDEAQAGKAKAKKAPSAFRTISEVADELHIPQHVLRFWETKFPQVKPLKRGGGRRYYRPEDILLLRRVSNLLYIQGYTIKGVQRLLREGGGKLSDNIPPPAPDEREAPNVESIGRPPAMEPMLPMPGLIQAAAESPQQPRSNGRGKATAKPEPDAEAAAAPARPNPEVERLRGMLAEVLAELESIRTALP